MKEKARVKRDRWILAAVSAVVFFGTLVLSVQGPLYLSPDETANAIFTERFARTGTLWLTEPLNSAFDGALHPRSMATIGERIVPGSFLGLPVIYGAIVAVTGTAVLPLLTPLIAIAAVFAGYEIARRLFDRQVALMSAILLASMPAWWYYAARALMHNVLFTSMLVFTAFFLVTKPAERLASRLNRPWLAQLDIALSGVLAGLAVFVRTSEAVWLLGVALVIAGWYARRIRPRAVLLFVLSVLLGLAPMAFANQAAYGSAATFGYTIQRAAGEETVRSSAPEVREEPPVRDRVETALEPAFPFGIHPRLAARHFDDYALSMFWWLSVPALLGIAAFWPTKRLSRDERRFRGAYLCAFAFVSAYLVLMYGSWVIQDNPDPDAVTIGNSYVRYWLPMFVLAMPLAAFALRWLAGRSMTRPGKRLAAATLLLAAFGLNLHAVFFRSDDGLVAAAASLREGRAIQERALELVEPDAVVVVDRADKLFFPHRRVVLPLREEATYRLLPRLARRGPLYYYGITFPPRDMEYLNETKLPPLGLRIDLLETFDAESLYRIYAR